MPSFTNDSAFWLFASLALSVAATNLAWLVTRGPLARRWLRLVAAWPGLPALAWLAAALYLLLPPFVAWRIGRLSFYFAGLTETDWIEALGSAGLLAAAIISLALAGWLFYRRSLRGVQVAGRGGRPLQLPVPQRPAVDVRRWSAPIDSVLGQWHWTFYRSIVIAWLAGGAVMPDAWLSRVPLLAAGPANALLQTWRGQPIYWGSWLGLLLIALEWLLNPFTWSDLRRPGTMEGVMRVAGLAVATTALFSLTRNFWLCLLCGVAVETLIAGWLRLES